MIRKFRPLPSLCCGLLCMFNLTSFAADSAAGSSTDASATPSVTQPAASGANKESSDVITELKVMLANQQKQIEELRRSLEEQKKMLESATGANPAPTNKSSAPSNASLLSHPTQSLGDVASLTPIIPSGSGTPTPGGMPAITPQKTPSGPGDEYPVQLHLGAVTIMPVGFMDFTSAWRSTNTGSGIGSNFGSIPYLNTTTGHLSEFRLSAQNSRIGARIDGDHGDTHFIGYWESDFLGSPTSNNYNITNHAYLFRMRLYWIDVRKDKWELLGGQSWSLMTPGRSGISPLPGDIFYSQDIDVNYQLGLVWARTPGLRVVYHPSSSWAMGLAFEDPEGSVGGSGGNGAVVLPAGVASAYGSQLDAGSGTDGVPNVMPDISGKIAYDYKKKFHFEVAGVFRDFKVYNLTANKHYYTQGGGGSVNLNVELAPGFRLLTNNYWSDGGGRYIFGLAPDVAVRGNGSLADIHSGSTVDGFEFTHHNDLIYAYYGGVYIGRYVTIDPSNGKPVGYGYTGSANSQNRALNEVTFGFNHTFWKSPKLGAINFMGQYSWLSRNPWYVASGQPDKTHTNIVYFNLRYTLPGAPPPVK